MRRFTLASVVCCVLLVPGHAADHAYPQETAAAETTVRGEAMYPVSSKQMWDHVQALVTQLGFRAEKRDEAHQVLVTRWRDYETPALPAVTTLKLAPTDKPLRIQLHFLVAPARQPARVALGSIIEFERREGGKGTKLLAYRTEAIDAWLFAALDARAGARHEDMAGTWDARKAQAARLMPPGLRDPCLGPSPSVPKDAVKRLVPVTSLRPVFPAGGAAAGERLVQINSELTEHGTLSHLKIVGGSAQFEAYEMAARAAASLWRFEPVAMAGCPIATFLSLEIDYTIR